MRSMSIVANIIKSHLARFCHSYNPIIFYCSVKIASKGRLNDVYRHENVTVIVCKHMPIHMFLFFMFNHNPCRNSTVNVLLQ